MSNNRPLSDANRAEAVHLWRFGKHLQFHEVARQFSELSQEIAVLATCWAYDGNEDFEDLRVVAKAINRQLIEFQSLLNRYEWEESNSLHHLVQSGNQQLQEFAAEQGDE